MPSSTSKNTTDRPISVSVVRDLKALSRDELEAEVLRLRARDDAADSQHRRAIFESAIDFAIVVTDRAGCITDWNTGAERTMGWSAAEMIGHNAERFFTPEDRAIDRVQVEMTGALRDGSASDERWHLRKDGGRFWASGEMMPLREPDGSHRGFVKILRDRTEQRLAGERLAESEARYRTLFDTIDEGFCVIEFIDGPHGPLSDYVHVEANPAYERHTGIAGVVGRTIREMAPGEADGWVETYGNVLRTGRSVRFERAFVLAGRDIEVAAHRVEPATRRQVAILFNDITGRVRADRALQQSGVRKAALLELGDRLRETDDAQAMAYAGAEIMGRTLGATQAGYGTVDLTAETVAIETDWTAPGHPSVVGLHPFRAYGSYLDDLKHNEVVMVADVTTDPRTHSGIEALAAIGVRTFVNVPLIEHGALVAILFVHHDRPHAWTEEEFVFVRNVADRTRAGIARVRSDEQQRLMAGELSHRLKNSFTMVQAIANQTLRTAPDMESAKTVLGARLQALSRAHDILMTGAGKSADIGAVIEGALAPLLDGTAGRVTLDGPPCVIDASAAQSLSLMIHELATNAIKYGALSALAGTVSVAWSLDDIGGEPILTLRWAERGGPPVTPPTRRGFGSRLIERGLAGTTGGAVRVDYPPEGVTCVFTAPKAGLQARLGETASGA